MKEKKVNKQKIKGEDIVNIVDSPGAIVSKSSGIMDEVISALDTHPMKAIEPLGKVKRVLDSYHPYYKFVPNFLEDGKPSMSIVAKTPDAFEKCPIRGNIKFKLPERYQKFSSMADLLSYSYLNQEPIILDEIYSLKTFMGNQLLDEIDSSNCSKISVKMIPQSFPEPRPVRISILNTEIAYNYIELQVTKINGSIVFLSNEKQQDALVRFFLTLDFKNTSGSYKISFDEEIQITAQKLLKMLEFLLAVYEGKTIRITDIKTDRVIFEGSSDSDLELSQSTKQETELYRKIVFVGEKFDLEFELPEIIEEDDVDQIDILYEIITKGEITGQSDDFTFIINQKQCLLNIIDVAQRTNNQISNLMVEFRVERKLFGSELQIGRSKLYLPPVKVDNLEKLSILVDFYKEGTDIEVRLVSLCDNSFRQVFLDVLKQV